jgi:hypothetical protein
MGEIRNAILSEKGRIRARGSESEFIAFLCIGGTLVYAQGQIPETDLEGHREIWYSRLVFWALR